MSLGLSSIISSKLGAVLGLEGGLENHTFITVEPNIIIENILFAMLITSVSEVIVGLLFGFRKKHQVISIILVNLITNPLMNFFILTEHAMNGFSFIEVIFFEVIVILVEWLLLFFALKEPPKKLFILSLVMNLVSFGVGYLITSLPF